MANNFEYKNGDVILDNVDVYFKVKNSGEMTKGEVFELTSKKVLHDILINVLDQRHEKDRSKKIITLLKEMTTPEFNDTYKKIRVNLKQYGLAQEDIIRVLDNSFSYKEDEKSTLKRKI